MAKGAITPEGWSATKSAELYNLAGWGSPYFSIDGRGRLCAHPDGEDGPSATLADVVDAAREKGLSLPLLVRFDGILRARLAVLRDAFRQAAGEYGYRGRHRPVYPIKVNQMRHVVEALRDGDPELGLEVGSKPEMLAVVALLERPRQVVCNGYKDETYIELACLARRLGHEVFVVIEKPSEIETISRVVEREGLEAAPFLGVRCRLARRGAGRWESSAGDRAKFGLSASQLVEAVDWLRADGLLDRLRLLHFHLGSQINAIRPWKDALREASRTFVELARMGCPLDVLDVGGGLAVDYDGSRTAFESSMNYSEREYANDVLWHVQEACDKAGLEHPDVVTESGRALAAHHAVLVTEVVGVSRLFTDDPVPDTEPTDSPLLGELVENFRRLSRKNVQEVFHDAVGLRDEILQRYTLGLVDLKTRARAEHAFYSTLYRVQRILDRMDYVPDEFEDLQKALAETYFCNFSVFQSVPDHWAIRQIFPVMPIHRLDERPTVRAILGDMTCDSDGRMDRFVDLRDVKDVLDVHPLREGERYMLGVFLVGAYQEILGDLHNLFGDTDAVHVDFDADGKLQLVGELPGERVSEVLRYVAYDETWLRERYDAHIATLVAEGALTAGEGEEIRADLRQALRGSTYLTDRSVKTVRADDLLEIEDEAGRPPEAAV